MKGRKEHHEHREHEHHKRRAEGGFAHGVDEAEKDREEKTPMRVNAPKIEHEADEGGERKHGGHVGRRKRKHGGEVHHSRCKCEKCMGGAARKHGGHVMEHKKTVEMHGEHERHHAGRKPRKEGGRAGSNEMPFSSAHKGEQPEAHKAYRME